MHEIELTDLPTESLWKLYDEIAKVLPERMKLERASLDKRIKLLERSRATTAHHLAVLPKYRNPEQPSETWTGRGKRPRWLAAKLNAGQSLSDFEIRAR